MTIGELIIKLGFKVEGVDDAEKAAAFLDKGVSAATKLAVGVDAATAGFAYLIERAVTAAVGMQKFGVATGLSAQDLQQWEYRAHLANVSMEEMAQTVLKIQSAGVKVATTGEGAQPWVLLGIDPRQNPFDVLRKLSAELQSTNARRVALARQIVEQTGISTDVFQMLRRPAPPPLPARYVVDPQAQRNLEALNTQLQQLGFLTNAAKNRFAAELAPELTRLIILLEKVVDRASRAIDWLSRHPTAANWIADAAVAVAGLGAALTGIIGTMKLVATGAELMNAAFLPIIATVGEITAGITAAIALAFLLQKAQPGLVAAYDKYIKKAPGPTPAGPIERAFTGTGVGQALTGPMGRIYGHVLDDLMSHLRDSARYWAAQSSVKSGATTNVFNNKFEIHEAGDASKTRDAVGAGIAGQLAGAGASAQPQGY